MQTTEILILNYCKDLFETGHCRHEKEIKNELYSIIVYGEHFPDSETSADH